ncbi:MAG: DUF4926 domain-containing protein [Longimicrobiales bacterium]
MKEHDLIVLTDDLPEHGLRQGDIGTIVHVHADGAAIEAEFMVGSGQTVAVLTLPPSRYRALEDDEILHARRVTT